MNCQHVRMGIYKTLGIGYRYHISARTGLSSDADHRNRSPSPTISKQRRFPQGGGGGGTGGGGGGGGGVAGGGGGGG